MTTRRMVRKIEDYCDTVTRLLRETREAIQAIEKEEERQGTKSRKAQQSTPGKAKEGRVRDE